jgi:hypothetical protein
VKKATAPSFNPTRAAIFHRLTEAYDLDIPSMPPLLSRTQRAPFQDHSEAVHIPA